MFRPSVLRVRFLFLFLHLLILIFLSFPPHHRSLLTLRFSMHLHPATFCCFCVSLSHNYRPLSLHSSYSSPLPSASHTYFCSTFSFVCSVSLRRFAPDVPSIRYTHTRSVASRCFQNLSIFWNYRFNGKGIRRSFLFARNTVVSSAETCSTVKEQKSNCLLATYYFYTMDRCCSKNVEFENSILFTLNISTMSTTLTYFRSENVEKKLERNWKEI